jgi:hypothetical protein
VRLIIGLLVIIYLVGVGVALAPTIKDKSNSTSASELATSVAKALPTALSWPAMAYRSMTERG